jgi:hypothetical protein
LGVILNPYRWYAVQVTPYPKQHGGSLERIRHSSLPGISELALSGFSHILSHDVTDGKGTQRLVLARSVNGSPVELPLSPNDFVQPFGYIAGIHVGYS